MAIKLPKDIIESGYRFESCFPQPVIETEKKPDGSFKAYAKYDALLIDGFVKDMARDMNEKISAELIDELLRLNGYVPERTCRVVRKTADIDGERMTDYTCCFNQPGWNNNFCPNCGARVVEEA